MNNTIPGNGFSKLKRMPVVNRAMKNIIMNTIRLMLIAWMSRFLCRLINFSDQALSLILFF
jgi:hypothetical protein